MPSATRTDRRFDSNRRSLFRLHRNRFSQPVSPDKKTQNPPVGGIVRDAFKPAAHLPSWPTRHRFGREGVLTKIIPAADREKSSPVPARSFESAASEVNAPLTPRVVFPSTISGVKRIFW